MLNTKDVKGFLKPLETQIDKLFGISIPDETNTLSGKETSKEAKSLGIESSNSKGVTAALEIIKNEAKNPRIIICGSLYLAGHVLKLHEYEIK
jgi:dihydrofolate synthase/folylpolyglutamate synthase